MKKAASSAFLICVALAGAANATTISSSFDTDLDGWTGQGGILVWNSTGGNPGGFLQENDTTNSNMQVVAPAKFLGNLNGFTLTVDIRQLVGSEAGTFGGFGAITITGGGGLSMTADLGSPALTWTTYTMPFSAAAFGNDANFNTIISSVTKIQLALDPRNQETDDQVGMDNFTLSDGLADVPSSVPEPATMGLLGVSLIGVGLARKRYSRQ